MNRLINADEILRYLNRLSNSGLGKQKTIEYITKYISNMPTAFDVEKVISNIWDRSELIHVKHNCYDEVEDYIRVTDVSEIVKAGGIDEFNKKTNI